MDTFNTIGMMFLIPEAVGILLAVWLNGKIAAKAGKSQNFYSVLTAVVCLVMAVLGWLLIYSLGAQIFYRNVLSFVFAAIGAVFVNVQMRGFLKFKRRKKVGEPKILTVKPAGVDFESLTLRRRLAEQDKDFYIKGGNYKYLDIEPKDASTLEKGEEKPKKKNWFLRNIYILLAFFFPVLFMVLCYAARGVAPFGNLQTLIIDSWHQYYPFLLDLHEKLQSGGSLFWSWNIGGGTNYLSLLSYYELSPLNWLSVFVPTEHLRLFWMYGIVAKIGFASAFFAIMLRYLFKKNDLSLAIFGSMFALSAFFMGYYWDTMWLDTAALTPLVIMGMYKLMREGKFLLYVVSLAVALMANYYIGLFLCYFTLLMFVVFAISNWQGAKNFISNLLRMGVYTVLSLFITACVTIPAFLGLQNTVSTGGDMPTSLAINNFGDASAKPDLPTILALFGKVITNTLSFITPNDVKTEALPNIYCGLAAVFLGIIFFTSKKFRLREKVCYGVLLSFIILSFIIRQLDFIWNGFHFTNMIPYRFSFLFSFVLVLLAFRAYHVLAKDTRWDIVIACIFMALILLYAFGIQTKTIELAGMTVNYVVIGSLLIAGIFAAVFLLHSKGKLKRSVLNAVIAVLVLTELFAVTKISVESFGFNSYSGYPMEGENVSKAVELMKEREAGKPDIWRAETTRSHSVNDSALNQYPGLSMFSSMANVNMTYYTQNFGFSSWPAGNRYAYYETSPVSNLFFNLKYQISRNNKYNNTKYMQEIFTQGSTKLLENTKYLPMGFVVSSDIYKTDEFPLLEVPRTYDVSNNPFDVQNQFFKAATEIETPVYDAIIPTAVDDSKGEMTVSETAYGKYYFTTVSGTGHKLKFYYTAPQDGLYCAFMQVPGGDNMNAHRATAEYGLKAGQTIQYNKETEAYVLTNEDGTTVPNVLLLENETSGKTVAIDLAEGESTLTNTDGRCSITDSNGNSIPVIAAESVSAAADVSSVTAKDVFNGKTFTYTAGGNNTITVNEDKSIYEYKNSNGKRLAVVANIGQIDEARTAAQQVVARLSQAVKTEEVDDYTIGRPNIAAVGEFKKGDLITLYTTLKDDTTTGSMQVYFNRLNSDVFEQGYEILSKSVLQADFKDDTHLNGTINVQNDGVFYTSIPYEKGWSVKVDGEQLMTVDEYKKSKGLADSIEVAPIDGLIYPIGDALLAFPITKGQHTIEISYIPNGFVPGMSLTIFGIVALAVMCILRHRLRKKAFFKVHLRPLSKDDVQEQDAED
ncbi:MAG: YfhO family protein [Oscillospiraceae bacterium]|jgi:uncharacterized membrane protein YfhO|nr:YfhO family protein [Oscillospiraceae bacterium]